MIIPIDKEIRIRGTADCWQLEKSRLVKGQTRWTPFKYFSGLGHAVSAAVSREIRIHPANCLKDAITAINQIGARYEKLLDDALASGEAAWWLGGSALAAATATLLLALGRRQGWRFD